MAHGQQESMMSFQSTEQTVSFSESEEFQKFTGDWALPPYGGPVMGIGRGCVELYGPGAAMAVGDDVGC